MSSQYNASNELTSSSAGSYAYDPNGNTISDANGRNYNWDFENRLTQVTLLGSGGSATFRYSPFGKRIQKSFTQSGLTTVNNYIYDAGNVIQIVDASGTIKSRYTHEDATDQPLALFSGGSTSYYQQDGLGSITSLSSPAGDLVNTYSYDSYGRLTGSTGTLANPFQYTGREYDSETGLYYYRARYYDPSTGRFLSQDPIGFDGGVNSYAYVDNSPSNATDPFGLQAQPKPTPGPEPVPPQGPVLVPDPEPGPGPSIEPGPSSGAGSVVGAIVMMLLNPQTLNPSENDWLRHRDYENYKNRCYEPEPPGLDPCASARWRLQRNTDCRNMRQAWDDKWMPGRHQTNIDELDSGIAKLKKWIERNLQK